MTSGSSSWTAAHSAPAPPHTARSAHDLRSPWPSLIRVAAQGAAEDTGAGCRTVSSVGRPCLEHRFCRRLCRVARPGHALFGLTTATIGSEPLPIPQRRHPRPCPMPDHVMRHPGSTPGHPLKAHQATPNHVRWVNDLDLLRRLACHSTWQGAMGRSQRFSIPRSIYLTVL